MASTGDHVGMVQFYQDAIEHKRTTPDLAVGILIERAERAPDADAAAEYRITAQMLAACYTLDVDTSHAAYQARVEQEQERIRARDSAPMPEDLP